MEDEDVRQVNEDMSKADVGSMGWGNSTSVNI